MLTVILKKGKDIDSTQLTQKNILREIWSIKGSELLLEDTWLDGLKKTRTPYVCLVEPDCTLSSTYFSSNFNLLNKLVNKSGKGGGYTKLAMLASCLGVVDFSRRIYNYELEIVPDKSTTALKYWQVRPYLKKRSTALYHIQIGFVPGAIMRYSSIKEMIDEIEWDHKDMVQMSTAVCFRLWNSGRRIQVNPNTTYVSNNTYLENPDYFEHNVPDLVRNIFGSNFKLELNLK